jgi:hypothetical protein
VIRSVQERVIRSVQERVIRQCFDIWKYRSVCDQTVFKYPKVCSSLGRQWRVPALVSQHYVDRLILGGTAM